MEEKRRYKRSPIHLTLEISEVFKQDNDIIKDLNTEIEVFDISKDGIGFYAPTYIPEGYYFNATIQLGSSNQKVMTVVKILRRTELEDGHYRYGCQFTGLAGIFDNMFDIYEHSLNREDTSLFDLGDITEQ